jgi:putative transposase
MTETGDYRRGRHVVSALHVHLVFVTKYRRGVLDTDMLEACQTAMRKVCGDFGAELREFNGEHDHVHLLVEYPPKVAVAGLVNSLKGVSARRLRSEFTSRVNRHIMHGHLWSPSYFAASCGGAPLSIIRQYIEQQRRPVNATSGLTPH